MLPEWAIRSGPRQDIFFDPEKVCVRVCEQGVLVPVFVSACQS